MFCAHHRVDRLTVILDCNRQQLDGWTHEILNTEPLAEKWRAFGWYVVDIDGHDLAQIGDAFAEAHRTAGVPTLILARTVKGKGVSFMENNIEFHGAPPTPDQLAMALSELS